MKLIRFLLALALPMASCAELTAFQKSPSGQALETAAISIGVSLASQGTVNGAWIAPLAVSGLTWLANKGNPTAVSGIDLNADAKLITQTVAAALPTSAGKTAAQSIATAYLAAAPTDPTKANAVIAVIASGLTTGIAQQAAK